MSNVIRYLAVAVVAFAAAWVAQGWRADAEIADIERDAALAISRASDNLTAANLQTLRSERSARAAIQEKDDAYARLALERESAVVESARLSDELRAARERLRNLGTRAGSGAGVPAAAAGADGCADLRTALDRTLAALALYETAGDRIAADGQHAVDVATIAAQAAKEYPGEARYGSQGPRHAQADGTTVGVQPASPPDSVGAQ